MHTNILSYIYVISLLLLDMGAQMAQSVVCVVCIATYIMQGSLCAWQTCYKDTSNLH